MQRSSPRLGLLWLLAALLLSLAACSPADVRPYLIQPAPDSRPSEAGNRILVQGFDGNLFTVNPDGSGRFPLTDDASRTRQYQQATWSPDATTIAAARLQTAGQRVGGTLVLLAHDSSQRTELDVPFPPFYIHWNPTGDHIAYLSNWVGLEGPSMVLRLVDVAANSADTVAEGAPYYFSWAPDGSRLLAHMDNSRLELQTQAGERAALLTTTALFGAPQWSNSGDRIVYAERAPGEQRIVVSTLAGNEIAEAVAITTYDAKASFALSPDDSRIAYVLTGTNASANSLGPLYVTELDSLRTRELSEAPVWAYFWSPDSRKLAFLATDTGGSRIWLRWHVWDGTRVTPYGQYLPTRVFLENYLVFSDQYAQSMRIWSPDSTAFVYAGIVDTGNRRGVWVQRLGEPAPERVTSGVFATWSPR